MAFIQNNVKPPFPMEGHIYKIKYPEESLPVDKAGS